MSTILHAAWLPLKSRLFVWGETDFLRSIRMADWLPPHPFQANLTSMRAAFQAICGAEGKAGTETVWLPAHDGMPFASPELIASSAFPQTSGEPELTAFRVKGRTFTIVEAIDLLLKLPKPDCQGADWRAWRKATLLALEVVQAQEVYPTAEQDTGRILASWKVLPGSSVQARLDSLIAALPPIARAVVPDPVTAPIPQSIVESFVGAMVDSLVRRAMPEPALPGNPYAHYSYGAGPEWLKALGGKKAGAVRLWLGYSSALSAAWEKWAKPMKTIHHDRLRLTFRLEPPVEQDQTWRLSYFLQPVEDPGLLIPAGELWNPDSEFDWLFRRGDLPVKRFLDGLVRAANRFRLIARSLEQNRPEFLELTIDEAFDFLKNASNVLRESGFGVQVPAWWSGKAGGLKARGRARAQANGTTTGLFSFEKLVQFDWQLTLNGDPIDKEEFNRLAALKIPLVQHRGEWIALEPETLAAGVRFLEKGKSSLSFGEFLRYGLDPEGLNGDIEIEGVDTEGWLREVLERLNGEDRVPNEPLPAGLLAEMRPYQSRGYEWLAFLRRYGLGACLADDMGLGKTVQTIALLQKERNAGPIAPALVVSPTSVVGNWRREIVRFAPDLRVAVHHGADRHSRGPLAEIAANHDIVLTSYSLLIRDADALRSVGWSTVVLDEAQNIKNPSTKQAQVARSLPADFRIALSGTPVENRLGDLWSIMSFLNPGFLGSQEAFSEEFARPIERLQDEDAIRRLRRLTGGFILRRLKTDPNVIADLPEKFESKVYCSLTREQASLYEAVVRDALTAIDDADPSGIQRRGQVLAMLMKLKQVTNHPALFLKDGSELHSRSGKLERLDEMLEELIESGGRALIFTQFSTMGEMLQKHLSRVKGREVLFLHGGTPAKDREKMVDRYQAPAGPPIFVLSLKAGGIGLNLTAASTVFHFDRWWNPAVENQATDRAFRIGQTKNVQVYKFLCSGTLEERIDELIESKRSLAENVIGAGEQWLTELSTSELRDLVRLRREDVVGGRR